ncbi:MAG: hypothetical protein XD44_1152 [Methanobacteriaceae archaeon 41_258]|nr:MAG: hypothetical protein XD44_1152 [Methanobacteriaceae archaeon 41_258]
MAFWILTSSKSIKYTGCRLRSLSLPLYLISLVGVVYTRNKSVLSPITITSSTLLATSTLKPRASSFCSKSETLSSAQLSRRIFNLPPPFIIKYIIVYISYYSLPFLNVFRDQGRCYPHFENGNFQLVHQFYHGFYPFMSNQGYIGSYSKYSFGSFQGRSALPSEAWICEESKMGNPPQYRI